MSRLVVVAAAVAALSCGGSQPPAPEARPVPQPLEPQAPTARVPETPPPTLRLPATLQARAYRAHLAVDPARPEFGGELELDATLTEPASILWLNADGLTVTSAEAVTRDGTVALAAAAPAGGFLALRPERDLAAGDLTIRLVYGGPVKTTESKGIFAQTVDGATYVLTKSEALDARDIFPCIDEPSSKVPWTLTLDVPTGLVALGNAPVARTTDLGNGTQRVELEATPPLPTYLVAFAVGPFELVDAGKAPSGVPIRIVALKGRAEDARYAARETATIVGILEEYFGTPLPYPKLDLVPVPTTSSYGAMEHPGLIAFRQGLLLLPAGASADDKKSFDSVAAHEIAHMWFGDAVTLAWWDDIWLNEAFASWAEEKVMRRRSGWADGDEIAERIKGLDADRLVTARRIRQPVETNDDILNAFDGITYAKGAAVIGMFERWVGADRFRDGVRAYLRAHANGVADSAAFLTAIDDATPQDVTAPFASFLDQAGAPRVHATLQCAKDGPATVTLRQERWVTRGAAQPAGDPQRWQVPVCVAAGDARTRATTCTLLRDEQATVALDGPRCPTWILPNADATGYYRVGLAPEAYASLYRDAWKQLSTTERILVVDEGRALLRDGLLDASVLFDAIPRLRDGGPKLFAGAIALAELAHKYLPDDQQPAVSRWVRATFSARARKLGWLPRPTDDAATIELRHALLELVGRVGRDPKLLADARKLAKKWRSLPRDGRSMVIGYAVLSDRDFARRLLAEVDTLTDRDLHRDAVWGLTYTDDPELVDALLARTVDPKVDMLQEYWIPRLLAHRPNQPLVERFVREHADTLIARTPEKSRAALAHVMIGDCPADRRDDLAAWIHATIDPLPGGVRTATQAVESYDQCITLMRDLRPQLAAWLKKHAAK